MKSDELAIEISRVVSDAQARVLGVGAEQYERDGQQKFEAMPMWELVEYAREEALDLVNYGVMLTLRIERLADVMTALEGVRTRRSFGGGRD
jgi:uncharacterized protein (UPF0264 family)